MRLPFVLGREVVPVRLIPIITLGTLGQETLSGILANRLNIGGWRFSSDFDEIEVDVYDEATDTTECITKTRAELIGPQERENGAGAYHLNDGKTPVKMWASEWDAIFREIQLLESVLREEEKKNGVEQSMEAVWRLKATKILPPGVFLWKEDVDILLQRHTDHYGRTRFDPADFRRGANYDAYVRPEYQSLVWEGFEHLRSLADPNAKKLLESESAKVVLIGYSDFVRLCRVDDPVRWIPWLVIKPEGVWISPLPDDAHLEPTERAIWCDHPVKDLTKPLLSFPCSLHQLQDFIELVGAYGCVDPFDMAFFVLNEVSSQKGHEQAHHQVIRQISAKTKAQESLLKMVIGMAIAGYSYNPQDKKSSVTKEITEDIERQGLAIDPDTVRKWLREGVDLLQRLENRE